MRLGDNHREFSNAALSRAAYTSGMFDAAPPNVRRRRQEKLRRDAMAKRARAAAERKAAERKGRLADVVTAALGKVLREPGGAAKLTASTVRTNVLARSGTHARLQQVAHLVSSGGPTGSLVRRLAGGTGPSTPEEDMPAAATAAAAAAVALDNAGRQRGSKWAGGDSRRRGRVSAMYQSASSSRMKRRTAPLRTQSPANKERARLQRRGKMDARARTGRPSHQCGAEDECARALGRGRRAGRRCAW